MTADLKQNLRFVIAEDDVLYAVLLEDFIDAEFPHSRVLRIETESSFFKIIDLLENEPPDIFIIDMRLRFCDESNEASRIEPASPPDLAGARCIHELRKRTAFDNMPIVLCSVLRYELIQPTFADIDLREFQYVSKPWDHNELKAVIRSLLAARVPLPLPRKKDIASRIWDAFDAKVGVCGLKIDLKKILD